MESAIPPSLREERNLSVSTPPAYTPPFPAWTTRFSPLVEQVVMAYFGVQSQQTGGQYALNPITSRFSMTAGPAHWERATYCDEREYINDVVIAYWASQEAFTQWKAESGFQAWWPHRRENKKIKGGLWRLSPPISGALRPYSPTNIILKVSLILLTR